VNCKEFYRQFLHIDSPYEHQEVLWELLLCNKFPVFLKAPTGSGKTEAVIAPFLSQFVNNNFPVAPRLIYVLPMRVLANSMGKRIRGYSEKISSHISVELQHGDMPDSPFFIADIVVTTLDQFLYGFARTSHQVGHHIDVPAGAIASSLVVFDEAHMYRDGFTFSVMRAVMEILHHTGVPFVVMTATMPESLERSLFENIPINDEQKIHANVPIPSKITITIEDEPLYQDSGVSLSDEVLEQIEAKKSLIVLNQVKRAQRVYDELKARLELDDSQIVLLHSRFTRADRTRHEKRALSLLPHKENGIVTIPEGVRIVVSTQVLEAGIDFSAELLLTELAPADCLVQRAGRCARYEGQNGEIKVFPVEGDRAHMPYQKEHLERAIEWLNNHRDFDIKEFNQVCRFVNETLDYRADDFEAADTLIDLYECVLYTDSAPENIQIRKDKSAKVLVVEPVVGSRKRENREEQIRNGVQHILDEGKLGDFSFDVDIKVLWGWFKDGLFRYELGWKEDEDGKPQPDIKDLRKGNRQPVEEDPRISPFKTYMLESSHYDPEKGVLKDEGLFI